ncbi:MAG TPA: aldehyde dehydrogenase family protein [Planctomycetota bacterium]|nr:aldehyde dehydrogenase family protein [Planctomycetota bacterium]
MTVEVLNVIAGARLSAASGAVIERRNPADRRDLVSVAPASGEADVDRAVAAAAEAFRTWRLVPAPRRGLMLAEAGRILASRKEEVARLMTREMGKPLPEARGDVQEAIDTTLLTAAEGRRLNGDTAPCELPNKFGMSIRQPVGVCAMITPWNFPVAIPSWKILPALVCGNTVVLKPSELTPACAEAFVSALVEAGVPPGVVNLVCGAVGAALTRHPGVRAVSFTGSTEVGKLVGETCGRLNRKCSLEMGGKNAQIVMHDADLDLALEGALWGAFGTTGQRCTATSRLILHREIADEFVARLRDRAAALRLGDGLAPDTQVGPLVDQGQRDRVHDYVRIGREEGAVLALGGDFARGPGLDEGWFYRPTIFTGVRRGHRIAREEIFGPVTACIVVDSFEEAVDVHNDVDFGLSSSIYTKDVDRAFRAIRDLEAGITYVNGPTIGAEVQLPFGGVKGTGNGHREAGSQVYEFYTEWKSVYVDYSGRLQRAQIDV